MTAPAPKPGLKILAVCTANICRSPMVSGFLRAGSRAVGLHARVASAGFMAADVPVAEFSAAVMADRGIDIASHRSNKIRLVDINAADLILTMEREHVREIVGRSREALAKTYSIREFDQLGRAVGPYSSDDAFGAWLSQLAASRDTDALIQRDTTDDVADPYGGPRRGFEKAADELDVLSWTVLDLLAGYHPK